MKTIVWVKLLQTAIFSFVCVSILAAQTQTNLPTPAGNGVFGETVTALPNGNFVVTDSGYDAGVVGNADAVHLYDGANKTISPRRSFFKRLKR